MYIIIITSYSLGTVQNNDNEKQECLFLCLFYKVTHYIDVKKKRGKNSN